MKIAENAGYEGSLIAAKLLEEGNRDKGFDAASGKYVNMKTNGIIDPTKVVKSELIDSSSVASLMLTTECMIYDEPEKKDQWYHLYVNNYSYTSISIPQAKIYH